MPASERDASPGGHLTFMYLLPPQQAVTTRLGHNLLDKCLPWLRRGTFVTLAATPLYFCISGGSFSPCVEDRTLSMTSGSDHTVRTISARHSRRLSSGSKVAEVEFGAKTETGYGGDSHSLVTEQLSNWSLQATFNIKY